jgi:hypothetical protein
MPRLYSLLTTSDDPTGGLGQICALVTAFAGFTILDRTERCFDLKPKRLAADTAYGTGKFLGWLVKEKKIIPHIPVWEMSDRQDASSRARISLGREWHACAALSFMCLFVSWAR